MEIYNNICSLVDETLEINKKLQDTSDTSKKGMLEREVKVYQEKIDELVYELYGLTQKERDIVDGLSGHMQNLST